MGALKTQGPSNRNHFALLALLLVLALLLSAELTGKLLLWRRGGQQPYTLFFQPAGAGIKTKNIFFPLIDPLLGWGRSPPFERYFSDPVPEEARSAELKPGSRPAGVIRIVALGGSTTDPRLLDWNWVRELSWICGRNGLRCELLNGGVSGYASPQELLKLLRDVIPLEPDLVISLNGINDAALPVLNQRSFVNNHQHLIEAALRTSHWDSSSPLAKPPPIHGLLPHARLLLATARFLFTARPELQEPVGIADGFGQSKRWEWDVRMMHALAREFGFRYFVFLQPHLGLHPQLLAEKMKQMNAEYSYDAGKLQKFYREAQAACRKMPYCADLSGELSGRMELFIDPMHLRQEGHRLEAERIFQVLRARAAIPAR